MASSTTGNHAAVRDAVVRHLMADCPLDESSAREVERGVFNWALEHAERSSYAKSWRCPLFHAMYAHKAKSVLANVTPDAPDVGNARLLTRLHEGEFRPSEIAWMKHHDVFPERWKLVMDQKVEKDNYANNAKPVAMTNQFRCSRCKKRECVHHELQLRSCDEPATQFITCLNCNNRWKIG